MPFLRIVLALFYVVTIVHGFPTQKSCTSKSLKFKGFMMTAADDHPIMKKIILPFFISSALLMGSPMTSNAFWNESGEWVELKESSVTEVWGDRLKKASTMKPSDIFMAAKGAGNNDKR